MSVFRPDLFKNCVAIVTGGGTGIGRAIAYELLSLGCNVVIASRNTERLNKSAEELAKIGNGNVTPITCNIRCEDEVKFMVSETIKKYGRLDFLVNNAGGEFFTSIGDMKLEEWNEVIETNLTGSFLVSKEAYNQWFKNNGGSIVNILVDMWRGFPGMGHTGAARAGVLNLTQTTAVEWATNGVRVNAVAPGVISSKPSSSAGAKSSISESVKEKLPSKRCGIPDEISGAVCFLLSPASSYISGSVLKVDCASSLYSELLMWPIDEHCKLPATRWIPEQM